MTDEADGRPTRPATPITDPPTPEPAATDAPSIGSGSDDALPGIGPVPPTMALPAREPPEPTASPGGSAGPWAGAQEPPAAGPGPMTELGPLAFVICVGFVVGLAAGGVAGAVGGIIIAAPVGLVLFPPGRHLHALTYRGTPWTVSYALGLVALLVVCQLVFGLTAGALMAILGAQSLAVFGMAGAVGATALVTMIALSRSIDRGVDWASLGLYRGQLLENVWTGVQAGLVMVAINLLSIRVMCSLDIWQLEGITFGNMLFKVDTLGGALLALVGGALIVPICEEILFRGILFSALRRSRGPLPAVILSSVIFGLLHLPDALRPALIGVLLGTLYHVTGNLWVSITAHSVLNGATLVLSWDHGALVGSMSWTVAGLVLLLLAFLVVPPASVLEKAPLATPKACPCCGASWQASARCPECGHPGRRRLSPAVRWSVRCVAVAFLLFASFLSCLLDLALAAPYASSWPADLLGMKHEALLVMGRDREAQALARDWAADRPDDEAPQMLIVGRAYRRQDYAGALNTTGHEPGVPRPGGAGPGTPRPGDRPGAGVALPGLQGEPAPRRGHPGLGAGTGRPPEGGATLPGPADDGLRHAHQGQRGRDRLPPGSDALGAGPATEGPGGPDHGREHRAAGRAVLHEGPGDPREVRAPPGARRPTPEGGAVHPGGNSLAPGSGPRPRRRGAGSPGFELHPRKADLEPVSLRGRFAPTAAASGCSAVVNGSTRVLE
ncbi:MAG: CPBP family intramembrane metalloprotease [Candidatus Riflebacteria bacterium]|nr:CPBP family intramembrane metalloprotease [Candidatus Riflebacteria bacterium]